MLRTRRGQLLIVGGVSLALALLVGVWFVRRDDSFVAEQAPLVKPVVYGERVTRVVDPDVGLGIDEESERECVLARLNSDTALVEALGDQPKASPRFGEVEKIAEQCQAMASTAGDLKGIFVKHKQPEPNETQLRCLGEAMAAYPVGERDEVVHAEIVNVPAGALRDKVRELLAICGLDSSMVPPPG